LYRGPLPGSSVGFTYKEKTLSTEKTPSFPPPQSFDFLISDFEFHPSFPCSALPPLPPSREYPPHNVHLLRPRLRRHGEQIRLGDHVRTRAHAHLPGHPHESRVVSAHRTQTSWPPSPATPPPTASASSSPAPAAPPSPWHARRPHPPPRPRRPHHHQAQRPRLPPLHRPDAAGIPVGTLAIGPRAAKNAALLAASILPSTIPPSSPASRPSARSKPPSPSTQS